MSSVINSLEDIVNSSSSEDFKNAFKNIYSAWNTASPTTNVNLVNSSFLISSCELTDENYGYYVNYINYTHPVDDSSSFNDFKIGAYWFFKEERPYIIKHFDSEKNRYEYNLQYAPLLESTPSYNGFSGNYIYNLYKQIESKYINSFNNTNYPKLLLLTGFHYRINYSSYLTYNLYGNTEDYFPSTGGLIYSGYSGKFQQEIKKRYPDFSGWYYDRNLASFFTWYSPYNSNTEILDSKFDTNIPIFDLDDDEYYDKVIEYVMKGDRSGEVIEVNSIDYTLYIDGDRLPNYNLNWNPDGLGKFSKDTKIYVEFSSISRTPIDPIYEHLVIKSFPFTNGSIKFNWSDSWQEINAKIPIIDNILNNKFKLEINAVIDDGNIHIVKDKVSVELHEKRNLLGELYENLISPSATNDTLTIDFGEGKDSDDYYDSDSDENDEHSPTTGYDIGACNLTACYELSVERLNNIAIKLWSEDFFSNILLLNNSPIENILSCKLLPLSLIGIESTVKIGNVDMGINGNKLNSTVIRYNVGNISIPRVANMGFLNYAPYTSITIFLPFIGFKELNTSDVMGRNISVDYIVDVITGACKCCINVNNYQCYEYDGNCGIDIPLSSSNRSQVEMGYVQSALGVVTNIGSGNYGRAIGETISGAVQQYHYNSNGSYSPSTGAYEDRTCFIIIDRPQYTEISNFGHTRGYKCQLTKTIKNLNGFLKTTDNVDLSNINAPKFCKDKILELLSSGVYV